jgi:hypothetical protein
MRTMKKIVIMLLALVIVFAIIYGCYWLAKNLSYAFFYEDMVQRTIVQMVKPEALK